jgi:hypothetical protein
MVLNLIDYKSKKQSELKTITIIDTNNKNKVIKINTDILDEILINLKIKNVSELKIFDIHLSKNTITLYTKKISLINICYMQVNSILRQYNLTTIAIQD